MSYKYLHVGRASDLEGNDRIIYRLLEIMPGLLSWLTFVLFVFLSWKKPLWAAIFIIAFDLYWLVKTVYLSFHLRANWKKMKHYLSVDWQERLNNLKHDNIFQLIILPFYKENFEVVSETIESLISAKWDKNRMAIVLAYEERAGEEAEKIANNVLQKYEKQFGYFILSKHPKDLFDEMPGKGSNIFWAAEVGRIGILDKNKIKYEDVLVSAFDIDTRVYPQYFLCLTWHFLTCEKPYRSSFQPVPLYNNNIWDAPALSRVVATSGTFWQMIQQERPERLATFSSHSMSFKALHKVGYWQRNIVSEDSRIFWNSFLYFDGDYQVIPISYPVSMDANLAPTFLQTAKNIYKQQRRWTWGVENVPYILFGFLKNKKISLAKKIRLSFHQLEGFWSLSTNPLLIFFLGWLPLMIGGQKFNKTLIAYNLPNITRNIMIIAMLGLIMSVVVSFSFLPKRPLHKKRFYVFYMILQWILVPITIPLFGAIPGLDAQTRLMFGRYMGFWVTPKHRLKAGKS